MSCRPRDCRRCVETCKKQRRSRSSGIKSGRTQDRLGIPFFNQAGSLNRFIFIFKLSSFYFLHLFPRPQSFECKQPCQCVNQYLSSSLSRRTQIGNCVLRIHRENPHSPLTSPLYGPEDHQRSLHVEVSGDSPIRATQLQHIPNPSSRKLYSYSSAMLSSDY